MSTALTKNESELWKATRIGQKDYESKGKKRRKVKERVAPGTL